MRKVFISLLLASAAASPALAERPHPTAPQQTREERQQAREDRQSAREERSSHQTESSSRPDRSEQRSSEPRQQPQPAVQGQQQHSERSYERPAQSNFGGGAANVEQLRQRQQGRTEQRADRVQQLRDNRELRQSNRPLPRVLHTRAPVVSNVPRPGTQPPLRVERNHAPVQWSSNWRNNNRYDWQNHRRHHRSLFHLGFYYDPFGWGYNPFQ